MDGCGESSRYREIVLLVEDDPADQELTRIAFGNSSIATDLRVVMDGEEALDYLLHRGAYAPPNAPPRPSLVITDLIMPRMSGFDVLRQVRGHAELRLTPVLVFTTSTSEDDIARCYTLGANSYVAKPVGLDQYIAAILATLEFWIETATLPPVRQ